MEKLAAGQKWWKVGAAAFLSLGLLAGCGDGVDQDNVDDGTEQEVEEDVNDAGEEVEQEVDEAEDDMNDEEDSE
ncbi:hypothetical protein CF394_10305 [Tetzosporium hominis]|uniref:Uncharacterized protein n=2 Tax=Caryophanaceae TaxID=186818 RepID=A0A264W1Z9_9BACL|nr:MULTISPECIES: hypothetical protein [Planococcaceae]OZS77593.1 hypothetical protein CF394_10305 [Tetzosporium hominis]PJK16733.1 hypothetical protein CQS04_06155 [Chryseomicrobium excrementi]